MDPTNVRFCHPDEPDGGVTLHLPMTAENAGRVMHALAKLGFNFEREGLQLTVAEPEPDDAEPDRSKLL